MKSADHKRPLKVFLCHAHADRDAVRVLYTRLTNDGVDAWLDKEKLLPGQDWELEIKKAVREADVVVVCLSKQFNQAGFRQKEVRLALDTAMEKPEGEIFIIPARLEECDTLESLRRWNWVDLFEVNGYEMLLRALRVRADKIGAFVKSPSLKKPPKLRPTNPANPIVIPFGESKLRDQATTTSKSKPIKIKTEVLVAIIGAIATIIAAIFGSPLIGKLFSPAPVSAFETQTADTTFLLTPPSPTQTLSLSSVPSLSSTSTLSPINTPSLTPTFSYGPVLVSDKDGAILMYVPEGDFTMGSDDNDDERPIHNIYLNSFWIDKTEVTNSMYELCVRSNVCNLPDNIDKFSNLSYTNHPVVYVSWNDASKYCSWVGRRLPTEAEWEKAARGTDARTYPWGTAGGCDQTNYIYGTWCVGGTTLVGQYETDLSPYGVYDMAGNVREWTGSLYRSYPYDPNDGRENMVSSDGAILRGGSWNLDAGFATTTFRRDAGISYSTFDIGFRCAFSP